MELRKERSKNAKREQVFTFLAHKNQLPFFFLCAKYGPKVNKLEENMIKEFNSHSFSIQVIWG